jgi:hypothetical protein
MSHESQLLIVILLTTGILIPVILAWEKDPPA